jgi:hypothetical protein
MAKAEKREEVVTTTTYHLELTVEEAEFLHAMMGCVGGSPSKSKRGHADQIAVALNVAGVAFVPLNIDYTVKSADSVYLLDN